MVAQAVEEFVRAGVPPPPARLLEVGAGSGELARILAGAGYDVVAIDPVGEGDVLPVALLDFDAPPASFDAALAVVSLHHVEPFEPSCARLASLVRPGGVLVVDEFDVARFDEASAAWLVDRWRDTGRDAGRPPAEIVAHYRAHLHPLDAIRAGLERVVRPRPGHARQLSLPLVPGRGVPGGRRGADRGRLTAGGGCAVRGDAEAGLMRVFRIAVPASDVDRARAFYERLLAVEADDTVPTRIYFHCGEVIVAVVDWSGRPFEPTPDHLYFATGELDAVHARALDAGAREVTPVETQPWGERSFYCLDLDGNRLCFVDETTLFLGRGAAWS